MAESFTFTSLTTNSFQTAPLPEQYQHDFWRIPYPMKMEWMIMLWPRTIEGPVTGNVGYTAPLLSNSYMNENPDKAFALASCNSGQDWIFGTNTDNRLGTPDGSGTVLFDGRRGLSPHHSSGASLTDMYLDYILPRYSSWVDFYDHNISDTTGYFEIFSHGTAVTIEQVYISYAPNGDWRDQGTYLRWDLRPREINGNRFFLDNNTGLYYPPDGGAPVSDPENWSGSPTDAYDKVSRPKQLLLFRRRALKHSTQSSGSEETYYPLLYIGNFPEGRWACQAGVDTGLVLPENEFAIKPMWQFKQQTNGLGLFTTNYTNDSDLFGSRTTSEYVAYYGRTYYYMQNMFQAPWGSARRGGYNTSTVYNVTRTSEDWIYRYKKLTDSTNQNNFGENTNTVLTTNPTNTLWLYSSPRIRQVVGNVMTPADWYGFKVYSDYEGTNLICNLIPSYDEFGNLCFHDTVSGKNRHFADFTDMSNLIVGKYLGKGGAYPDWCGVTVVEQVNANLSWLDNNNDQNTTIGQREMHKLVVTFDRPLYYHKYQYNQPYGTVYGSISFKLWLNGTLVYQNTGRPNWTIDQMFDRVEVIYDYTGSGNYSKGGWVSEIVSDPTVLNF